MNAWIVAGVFASLFGAFVVLNAWNVSVALRYKRERDTARIQRDRIAAENATFAHQLEEADAQLQKLVEELHVVRDERDDYATRLGNTDRAWTALAAERDALKQQLAERVYEVKPKPSRLVMPPRTRSRGPGKPVTTEVEE